MTSGGRIAVDGDTITTPGADRGVVFQEPTLFPWKTVLANVSLGPLLAGAASNEAERIGRKLLGRVGLSSRCESFPKHLSGGMQQRVGIARALANNPRVLLMDEPFGALDAQTRSMMQHVLLDVWAEVGVTVLFVTHDIDEAITLGDRILIMGASPGRIIDDIAVPIARPRADDVIFLPSSITSSAVASTIYGARALVPLRSKTRFEMKPRGRIMRSAPLRTIRLPTT